MEGLGYQRIAAGLRSPWLFCPLRRCPQKAGRRERLVALPAQSPLLLRLPASMIQRSSGCPVTGQPVDTVQKNGQRQLFPKGEAMNERQQVEIVTSAAQRIIDGLQNAIFATLEAASEGVQMQAKMAASFQRLRAQESILDWLIQRRVDQEQKLLAAGLRPAQRLMIEHRIAQVDEELTSLLRSSGIQDSIAVKAVRTVVDRCESPRASQGRGASCRSRATATSRTSGRAEARAGKELPAPLSPGHRLLGCGQHGPQQWSDMSTSGRRWYRTRKVTPSNTRCCKSRNSETFSKTVGRKRWDRCCQCSVTPLLI